MNAKYCSGNMPRATNPYKLTNCILYEHGVGTYAIVNTMCCTLTLVNIISIIYKLIFKSPTVLECLSTV